MVLSYGFWNDHFARDSHVIGRPMKISGIPAIIVGVTPAGFHGLWPGGEVNRELKFAEQSLLREFVPLDRQQLDYYKQASLRADSARRGCRPISHMFSPSRCI